MDGSRFETIIEKSSLLCSCFVILETTIVFVSKHAEQDGKGMLCASLCLYGLDVFRMGCCQITHNRTSELL